MVVYIGSDWAGCRRTAKSTSGGAVMRGTHCLKTWSSTQKTISLSSGEAELHAAVRTTGEAIGLMQMAMEMGDEMSVEVRVDSKAALGVVGRRGNGKLRHVRVGTLWLQQLEEEDDAVAFSHVRGDRNPADLMTKGLHAGQAIALAEMLSQRRRGGRAAEQLQV